MYSTRIVCIALLAGSACLAQAPSGAGSTFQKLVQEARSRIKEVTVAQFQSLMNSDPKPVVVDVREDAEWQAGHAAGAIHVGRGVLERDIENAVPMKDTLVVVYCQGGGRSALAADSLQKMGYTKVYSLAGGLNAYRQAAMPMAK